MSTIIQLKRGSTEKLDQYIGQSGELLVNTDDYSLRYFDGSVVGGYQIAGLDIIDGGIISEPEDKTVILTVGNYKDYAYGYGTIGEISFGSINKIPYWKFGDGIYALNGLYDDSLDGFISTISLNNISDTSRSHSIMILAIENDSTSLFYLDSLPGQNLGSQLEFKSKLGGNITLKFTPEPDGFDYT